MRARRRRARNGAENTVTENKGNVLIVDDSLTVRMDLADAFETVGLRPLLCSTIREARETFTVETIDLVILDVMLPDGDGVEFLKEIRTRLAAPDRCLGFSGHGNRIGDGSAHCGSSRRSYLGGGRSRFRRDGLFHDSYRSRNRSAMKFR